MKREAWLIQDAIPCIRLTLENGIVAEVITFVPVEKPVGVAQWLRQAMPTPLCFMETRWLHRL